MVIWTPQIEICSVNFYSDQIDDVSSAEIEGKFEVFDVGLKYIDCFYPLDGVLLLPDGTLSLSGPFRCLVGYDFGFRIYLKEKKKNLELSNGYHVQGHLSAHRFNGQPLSALVRGKDGYAIVNYILIGRASQATIEVFLNPSWSNREQIHGVMHAKHNAQKFGNIYDEKYYKTYLFNVSEEKAKKPNGSDNGIPLSRSKVAVPLGGKLIIEAELLQGKSVLAKGPIYFETQLNDAIQQDFGGVVVKVTWWGHPLKHPQISNQYYKSISKPISEVFDYNDGSIFNYDNTAVIGTRLAQVFALRIKCSNHGGDNCEVYGKITVQDDKGPLVLYDNPVGVEIGEPGDEGGMLALASVDRCIVAFSDWSINFDIKDKKGNEFINKTHIVSLSGPEANYDKMEKELFDKRIDVNVEGKMGVASVCLCVLKVAVSTKVYAIFVTSDESLDVNVFGTLHGRYEKPFDFWDNYAANHCRVVLFDKKECDDGLSLDKDPKYLFESYLAVPAYSSLILEADFQCVYSDGTKERIKDNMYMPVGGLGTEYLSLKGDRGEIKFNVWFHCTERS